MAISRAQIPEQIDAYQEGGDVLGSDDRQQPSMQELSDFDKSVREYEQRFQGLTPRPAPMNFFDLASELGAGLLQTPNVGGASAFTGLGVGFSRAAERLKKEEEDYQKQLQQVRMQAMQLALEDERRAEEYLQQVSLKLMGDTNKEVKTIDIQYTDPKTGNVIETVMDKSSALFKEIMEDPAKFKARTIKTPLVDMSGTNKQYEDITKELAKEIVAGYKVLAEEARGATQTLDKIEAARYFAEGLTEQEFGPIALLQVGIGSLLTQLGFGNLVDQEALAAQTAVNSVGTGLAMGLVGQTKGAISNREMDMFLKASATLGNNKAGFLQIIDITERINEKTLRASEEWGRELDKLMEEEKGVAEIASAYTTFLADFHKRNPLFDYGSGSANDYDENLSLEENLERLDKNSEAYRILAQTTAEGIDAFRGISAKHAAYTPVGKVAQDIKGVPDGAKSAGVYYNPDDEDDPRNGKPMWQSSDGRYHVEEDEESQ
tara:strand:- start:1053 stop:2522 length:1470 start_codon:yes stop_codon:yes gene_type:complete